MDLLTISKLFQKQANLLSMSDIYGTLIEKNILLADGSKIDLYFDTEHMMIRTITIKNRIKTENEKSYPHFDFSIFENRKELIEKISLLLIGKVWKEQKISIMDDLINNENYKDEFEPRELSDVLNPLSSNWQFYSGKDYIHRDGYYVRNVKGKGFPDYNKTIEKVANKLKISAEEVKEKISSNFLDDLIWEEINQYIDDNDIKVVGRSGGYWGFEWDNDLIEIDQSKFLKELEKIFTRYQLDIELEQNNDEKDINDQIYNMLQKHIDIIDYFKPTKNAIELIKKYDELIDYAIKTFENPDNWVDTIIANI